LRIGSISCVFEQRSFSGPCSEDEVTERVKFPLPESCEVWNIMRYVSPITDRN
jgi:hypothetical protein